MPVVTDYTALLSGDSWNGIEVAARPVIVTYSFPTTANSYVAGIPNFNAATLASWHAFTAAEQSQARTALGEWAAASGIIFIEVAPGQGDINFHAVNLDTTIFAGAGGIGFYPFGGWSSLSQQTPASAQFTSDLDSSGDVFMSTVFESGGTFNLGTLRHEIGHAIGLKHPTETVFSAFALHDQVLASDDPTLTIMAQTGGPPGSDVLHALDIAAAAALYGVAGTGGVYTATASGTNSVAAWSWNAATQTLTQTGGTGDDTIRGSSVKDVINGGDGADWLFGLNGDDTLNGGIGNDKLFGGPGTNTLVGGVGDDTYYVDAANGIITEAANGGTDTVISTVTLTLPGNVENLTQYGLNLSGTGNSLANSMFGSSGHAHLNGGGGSDYMVGGDGGNTLLGSTGDDTVYSGSGNDVINGGTGVDYMSGGAGMDKYYVDEITDRVIEAAAGGTDTVYTYVNYTLEAGSEVEYLYARLSTGMTLTGNEFGNRIYGGAGNDTLAGAGGNDFLQDVGGVDTMLGGTENDTYYVHNSAAVVTEAIGEGSDKVYAYASYALAAGSEVEYLFGQGTTGLALAGNEFANSIYGTSKSDTLAGNGGADKFVFTNAPGASNIDTITDFAAGSDTIRLSLSIFSAIGTTGTLNAAMFTTGVAATTAAQHVIYDAGTGNLFYDADGSGNGAQQVQFAHLNGGPALSNSSFVVF